MYHRFSNSHAYEATVAKLTRTYIKKERALAKKKKKKKRGTQSCYPPPPPSSRSSYRLLPYFFISGTIKEKTSDRHLFIGFTLPYCIYCNLSSPRVALKAAEWTQIPKGAMEITVMHRVDGAARLFLPCKMQLSDCELLRQTAPLM